MTEWWRYIQRYKGQYEISNFGRVLSHGHRGMFGIGYTNEKGRILVTQKDKLGYEVVNLNRKRIRVSHLVWDNFGKRKRNHYFVDHIDNNPRNNRIGNLQLLTPRENVIKGKKLKKHSSKYTGVCWDKNKCQWIAKIRYSGQNIFLGRFGNELLAALAYDKRRIVFDVLEHKEARKKVTPG